MQDQAWHDWRREGIGASDAPAIMGVSPWKTSRDIWKEKVYNISSSKETYATCHGKSMEEKARYQFEMRMDVIVFGDYKVVHPTVDYFRATLDGIDESRKIVVEIKCPLNREDHMIAAHGKVPTKYYPQLQHQLLVTELPGMYYYSFQSGEGILVEVERDDNYIEEMTRVHHQFWEHVKNKTEPPIYYPDHQNLEDEKRWIQAQQQWKSLLEEKEALKEKEKNLRTSIQEIANFKNAQGIGLKLTKSICKGDIDYDLALTEFYDTLKTELPGVTIPKLDKEKYRKKSFEKWIIRLC